MSLDKSIKYNKEKRKPYYGSKEFDTSCRNHGSCSWCEDNRNYSNKKRKKSAEEQIDEYEFFDER
jgi:hypothetical protein